MANSIRRASGRTRKGSGPYAKAAVALAREIREAGWVVETLDGHSFFIWPAGTVDLRTRTSVASFSSHPKSDSVVKHARSKLRKLGILPGSKSGTEVEMPVPNATNVLDTPALVGRVREHLTLLGGDTPATRRQLAERAVEILRFRAEQGVEDVEQFGSTGLGKSPPRDVARESIRGLLDLGMNATDKSWARWTTVLDEIEGAQPVPLRAVEPVVPVTLTEAAVIGKGELAALTHPVPVDPAVPGGPMRASDEPQDPELLELLAEAERERDAEKARADQAEAARADAVAENDRLADANRERLVQEGAATALATAAKEELAAARAELKTAAAQVRSLKGHLGKAKTDAVKSASAREKDLERQLALVAAELAEATGAAAARFREWVGADASLRSVVEQNKFLQTSVERLETDLESAVRAANVADEERETLQLVLDAQGPRNAVLDALLTELANANGAPGKWLLDRLDRFAGLDE